MKKNVYGFIRGSVDKKFITLLEEVLALIMKNPHHVFTLIIGVGKTYDVNTAHQTQELQKQYLQMCRMKFMMDALYNHPSVWYLPIPENGWSSPERELVEMVKWCEDLHKLSIRADQTYDEKEGFPSVIFFTQKKLTEAEREILKNLKPDIRIVRKMRWFQKMRTLLVQQVLIGRYKKPIKKAS